MKQNWEVYVLTIIALTMLTIIPYLILDVIY